MVCSSLEVVTKLRITRTTDPASTLRQILRQAQDDIAQCDIVWDTELKETLH